MHVRIIALRVLLPLFLFSAALHAHAADLQLVPGTGTYPLGSSFSVQVYVTNNTDPINAVSGSLSFPTDLLSVRSVSKAGSIITLWPDEPGYSNSTGTIHFEGAILNPGFSGSRGKIITITFVALRAGSANVRFTSGSVLANDGKGTSVLGQLGSGSYQINGAAAPAPQPAEPVPASLPKPDANDHTGTPAAPVVTSSTNPDQSAWYKDTAPSFAWNVPSGVTSVRISYDEEISSTPTHVYPATQTSKTLQDVEDGTHYFHIQFKNSHGWGTVSNYRFNVDTTAPGVDRHAFTYDAEKSAILVTVYATDTPSGITSYDITLDSGSPLRVDSSAFVNGVYAVPESRAGMHTVALSVFDAAGNHTDISGTVEVTPSALYTPVFHVGHFTVRLIDLLVMLGLLSLLSLLGLVAIAIAWYRAYHRGVAPVEKKKLSKKRIHKAFMMLRTELEKHVEALKKAQDGEALTNAEAALGDDMSANINDFERYLIEKTDLFD